MHTHLIWKSGKRELLYKGPIFDVAKVERTSTDGRVAPFVEVAARFGSPRSQSIVIRMEFPCLSWSTSFATVPLR